MFYQTVDIADLPRLLFLVFVELALSADNAIVLGLFVRSLPERLRKKALFIGIFSAFFLRAFALLGISALLHYFWIQLLGGAYLIYLSIHHFLLHPKNSISQRPYISFWKTLLLIELFDLAFAIDSILAGLAMISSSQASVQINPKLWIVYLGGMMGVLGIRYAAGWFSRLIDLFPRLETSAFLFIGWIGIKLCYVSIEPFIQLNIPYEPIFWAGMFLFLLGGFLKNQEKPR